LAAGPSFTAVPRGSSGGDGAAPPQVVVVCP
jgi:hypothetical protein